MLTVNTITFILEVFLVYYKVIEMVTLNLGIHTIKKIEDVESKDGNYTKFEVKKDEDSKQKYIWCIHNEEEIQKYPRGTKIKFTAEVVFIPVKPTNLDNFLLPDVPPQGEDGKEDKEHIDL